MKKNVIATVIAAAMMTAAMAITAFAGNWEQAGNGWKWNEGNGTYAANGWEWCDGNNDGISECYYFDANGMCLMNTQTPDGYTVNESGAWVENGVVKTQGAAVQNPSGEQTKHVRGADGRVTEDISAFNGTYQCIFAEEGGQNKACDATLELTNGVAKVTYGWNNSSETFTFRSKAARTDEIVVWVSEEYGSDLLMATGVLTGTDQVFIRIGGTVVIYNFM